MLVNNAIEPVIVEPVIVVNCAVVPDTSPAVVRDTYVVVAPTLVTDILEFLACIPPKALTCPFNNEIPETSKTDDVMSEPLIVVNLAVVPLTIPPNIEPVN